MIYDKHKRQHPPGRLTWGIYHKWETTKHDGIANQWEFTCRTMHNWHCQPQGPQGAGARSFACCIPIDDATVVFPTTATENKAKGGFRWFFRLGPWIQFGEWLAFTWLLQFYMFNVCKVSGCDKALIFGGWMVVRVFWAVGKPMEVHNAKLFAS